MSQTSPVAEAPSVVRTDLSPVPVRYAGLPETVPLPTEEPIPIIAQADMRPPCRRCLEDATEGELVHLTTYDPFPADITTPYRGSSPIFVHASGCDRFNGEKVPERQMQRLMALRAYDENCMMVTAEVVEGARLEAVAGRMLADEKAKFVNVHNAKAGCFAFKVYRAGDGLGEVV